MQQQREGNVMAKTRHIQRRMSQRGIKESWLELVKNFGEWSGDKCILNKKACSEALKHLDEQRKELIKVMEKGGMVLVEDNGAEITCYRLNSFKR